MPTDLTNDELIGVPLANLQPGELRRAFLAEAIDTEKKQEAVNVQRAFTALEGRQEEERSEHEKVEERLFIAREEHLLAAIHDREIEIDQEASELDVRTIKLADGRRAYVDGDKYRDAQGRELHNADRAEAEQLHLEQPDAATWREKQSIDEQRQAAEQLRRKVEKLEANGAGSGQAKALSGLEREFETKVATPKTDLPDYGNGDYMAAFGLTGNFKQVATVPTLLKPNETTGHVSIPLTAPAAALKL